MLCVTHFYTSYFYASYFYASRPYVALLPYPYYPYFYLSPIRWRALLFQPADRCVEEEAALQVVVLRIRLLPPLKRAPARALVVNEKSAIRAIRAMRTMRTIRARRKIRVMRKILLNISLSTINCNPTPCQALQYIKYHLVEPVRSFKWTIGWLQSSNL